jgi:hypothetical protein
LAGQFHRLQPVAGQSDNLKTWLSIEHTSYTFAEEPLIINDNKANML